MEIKINVTKRVEKTINVEFPYYYECDLSDGSGEHMYYGKMLEDYSVFELHEDNRRFEDTVVFQLKKSTWGDSYSNYFKEEYKSSEKEYEEVRLRASEFFKLF